MLTLEDFKGKKYKTTDGYDVEIVFVSPYPMARYPILSVVSPGPDESSVWLTADFKTSRKNTEPYLHEVTPYDDWPIGCLVICRDNDKDHWVLRRYTGVGDEGFPTARLDWSTNISLPWKEMRRVYE